MNRLRNLRFRLRAIFDRRRMDEEIGEEMAFHLDAQIAEGMRRGLSEEDARREALRLFGGARQLTEQVRDADGFAPIDALGQHIRYAVRTVRRAPAFAAMVCLTLGLGIGANGAMFGIIDHLLLRGPEGVARPDELRRAYVMTRNAAGGEKTESIQPYALYRLLRADTAVFASAGAYGGSDIKVGRGANWHTISEGAATWDFFRTLGARPYLGRFFDETEDRPPSGAPVVVLGYGYWRRELGGDSAIIGRTIDLDEHRLTVIGIAPPHFTGAERKAVDVWIPMSFRQGVSDDWPTTWNAAWVRIVGRLRPGVSERLADEHLTATLHAAYTANDPEMRSGTVLLHPISYDRAGNEPRELGVARLLYGVALLVLLIAAANVANLLLARATRRQRELGVRVALGAGRLRLATMMLTESLGLTVLGGIAGLGVGYWGGLLIRGTLLPDIAWETPPIDATVLAYTAAAVLLTTLLVGVAPAFRATRGDPMVALKSGIAQSGDRRGRTYGTLQVIQVALSVILLFTAGLFVRSLWRVRGLDLGLEPESVVTASIAFDGQSYRTSADFDRAVAISRVRSWQLLEEVRRLTGVRNASVAIGTPFYTAFGIGISLPGHDSLPAAKGGGPYVNAVGPGYFETVGTRLRRGRTFTAADHEGSPPVVIVNETMARTFWPDEDPLTKCLIIQAAEGCVPVVGVVADARQWKLREDPAMQFYLPYGQEHGIAGWMLLVRPTGHVDAFAGQLRSALARLAPDARMIQVTTLASAIDPQIRPWRVGALMFGLFGLLALVVAAVGLFSVVSYLVAQRTHELGVRIALGARASGIVRLVLGRAVGRTLSGIAIGGAGALVIAPWLEPFLFETPARDPLLLGGVALALLATVLLAGAIPAWRACRVEPTIALRAD